jgi:hypothetical protein
MRDIAVNFTDSVALGSSLATIVSGICTFAVLLLHRKVREIHVLVNDRLDTALSRIKELEEKLNERLNGHDHATDKPRA